MEEPSVNLNVKIEKSLYLKVKAINKIEKDMPINRIISDALIIYIEKYNNKDNLNDLVFIPLDNLCPICKKEIIISKNDFACVDIDCKLGHGAKKYMGDLI